MGERKDGHTLFNVHPSCRIHTDLAPAVLVINGPHARSWRHSPGIAFSFFLVYLKGTRERRPTGQLAFSFFLLFSISVAENLKDNLYQLKKVSF
jgi:hypothetical protein